MSKENPLDIPELDGFYKNRLGEVDHVLGQRINCNRDCRYYMICPLRPTSAPSGECLLAQMPLSFQQTFIDLFLEGRPGLIHEMIMTLWRFRIAANIDGSKKDAEQYFKLLLKFHREVYGSAKQTESPKDLDVIVREVGLAGAGPTRTLKSKDARLNGLRVLEDDIIKDDPESLFNSPILDTFTDKD